MNIIKSVSEVKSQGYREIEVEKKVISYQGRNYKQITCEKSLSWFGRLGFGLRAFIETLFVVPLFFDLKQITACWKKVISGLDKRVYLIRELPQIDIKFSGVLEKSSQPVRSPLFRDDEIIERRTQGSDFEIDGIVEGQQYQKVAGGLDLVFKEQGDLGPDAALALTVILMKGIPSSLIDLNSLSKLDFEKKTDEAIAFLKRYGFDPSTQTMGPPDFVQNGLQPDFIDKIHPDFLLPAGDLFRFGYKAGSGYSCPLILSVAGRFVILDSILSVNGYASEVWLRDPFQGAIKVSFRNFVTKYQQKHSMSVIFLNKAKAQAVFV